MSDGILQAQDRIEAKIGVNSVQGGVPLVLHKQTTAGAAIAQTAIQTLLSYSLPANSLNENGRGVRIRAVFTTGASGDDKTPSIKFGTAVIVATAATAYNDKTIVMEATVMRTGAATQDAWGVYQSNDTASTATSSGAAAFTTPSQDLTAAVTIAAVTTQEIATASDTVCQYLEVTLI